MSNDHGLKLLPCPFCGTAVEEEVQSAMGEYWVLCYHCRASGGMFSGKGKAIAAWNNRPTKTMTKS